jgi:hypothetical protein
MRSRSADEPPPETDESEVQVEMDPEMTVRALQLELHGNGGAIAMTEAAVMETAVPKMEETAQVVEASAPPPAPL